MIKHLSDSVRVFNPLIGHQQALNKQHYKNSFAFLFIRLYFCKKKKQASPSGRELQKK